MDMNKVITNSARVTAGIALITGLVMKTPEQYEKIGTAARIAGGDGIGAAQKFVLALFPILFLVFTLIKNVKVSKVLGALAAVGELFIITRLKYMYLSLIWKLDSSDKGTWTFYLILAILSLILSIAGLVVNAIAPSSTKRYSSAAAAPVATAYDSYTAYTANNTYANTDAYGNSVMNNNYNAYSYTNAPVNSNYYNNVANNSYGAGYYNTTNRQY